MKILITGGAGFVGSHLARSFREKFPQAQVVAFDNLKRRGSELNLPDFKKRNIDFVHGDIRNPSDFQELGSKYDLMVEASAEPSVLAGLHGSPDYLMHTNLLGTYHALEFARQHCQGVLFLSTSRVYSIEPLTQMRLEKTETRFEVAADQQTPGLSPRGITENFPVLQARSLYGASKLASELLIQEYVALYGLKAVTNRCGVIAGPGQFGKVDQGVFTLWVAHHAFNKPLRYTGFGGKGHQVRDLLHPQDLFELMLLQSEKLEELSGEVFNVGGGRSVSTSLQEYTRHCQEATGGETVITSFDETSPVDIPLYLSDTTKVEKRLGWKPQRDVKKIVTEIAQWLKTNEQDLRPLFGA